MQKILGILLMIAIVIGSVLMSYTLGSKIIVDYYLYGILGVIINFVIGIILFVICLFFMNKVVSKLYTKNKERI